MDMNSRMAMAEKLSVAQLQQAIQSGSLPAYIGIPLIEQKTKEKAQMAAAQGGQEKPPSVAASILQQAEQQEMQDQGIDRLPSNLPVMDDQEMGMAGGGIVAFAGDDGSYVSGEDDGLNPDVMARLQRDDPNAFQMIMRRLFGKEDPRDLGGSSSSTLFTPSVRERPFTSGEQTAGGASLPYRRQKGASNAPTPPSRPDFLPKQDLSLLQAPDYEGSFVDPTRLTAPQTRQADATLDNQMLADSNVGTAGAPSAPTGRGNQNAPTGGTPNAPTARQAAPTAQAPEAQPEGQSALDKYAAMLMAEREGSGKERDKAKGMALLQAGLGIMGGTSPNALANIAQGALPATQAYQQSIKGIRAEDAARLKELMGLGISKEKLALEAKKLGISEKRFNQMYELETQKIGIMGGSRADAAKNSEALRRDQLAANYFKTLYDKNPMATPQELEAMEATARRLARTVDASDTPPTNKYAGFSLVK
jgi:hypothetical protein